MAYLVAFYVWTNVIHIKVSRNFVLGCYNYLNVVMFYLVTVGLLQNPPPNFMNKNAEVLKSYKIVPVTFHSTDISINVESERNEQKKITGQIQHVESF